MENVAEEIKEMVREHGLCADWEREWDTSGGLEDPKLYDRLFDGMIWASRYGEDWPSKKYLLEKVGATRLEKNGIFADGWFYNEDAFPDLSGLRCVMLMGHSEGLLMFNDGKAHHLYARNDCNVYVYVEDRTMLNVMAYDRANVRVYYRKGCVVGGVMHGKDCKMVAINRDTQKERKFKYEGMPLRKQIVEAWRKLYFRARGLRYRIWKKIKNVTKRVSS